MAQTYVPPNSASPTLTRRVHSARLFTKSLGDAYFISKFAGKGFLRYGDGSMVGTDTSMPVQIIRDLERTDGDTIQYDLVTEIRGDAVYDDDQLKGKEKALTFGMDQIRLTQVRQAVSLGGRMSRKRSPHDLRAVGEERLRRYYSRLFDEYIVCYGAGTRGEGTSQWVLPTTWNGFGGNSLQTPDEDHRITIDSSGDISHTKTDATAFTLSWFDKLERYIVTMDTPPNPIMIGGEPKYILVLSPWAVEQMKSDTTDKSWLKLNLGAGVRGENNPLFTGSLGTYGMFIIHQFSKIPITTSGSDTYSHNLLFGAQGVTVAFGDAGGKFSFSWGEEVDDYGNIIGIAGTTILGVKKNRFNDTDTDFGVMTVYSKH